MNLLPKSRREIIKRAELSLTPMVDVVFLLLIFFMVGMKIRVVEREIHARLPGTGQAVGRPLDYLRVRVKAQEVSEAHRGPRIIIDGIAATDWPRVRGTFRRLARIPGATQTIHVVIDPDDDVPHDWVIRVLDSVRESGYQNIAFQR
jgi:biopolymer transport protein ExbD